MNDYEKTCHDAVDKWGKFKQFDMVIEELSELTKAIVKYRRHNEVPVWRLKILEEVADCEIMLTQMKYMLNVQGREYERILANKLENLKAIMKDDDPERGLNKVKK